MFVAEQEIEIRYAETDQMGVVYHSNYLVWLELGRTKLIQDLGFSYVEMEKDGIISPVLDLQISYRKAMRYGEKAIVKTWVDSVSPLRVIYGYEIYNGDGDLCITATTTNICVKKEGFRPVSLKKLYPEWYAKYEEIKRK
ncbi:acyl-CoA thioesterase [Bacillus cytotoxicus]|uniref:Thioesterase superfamily protein n=2 Tax=Bacillus cytotoxicus TaxID=580165 RepID=A0AAX2CJ54_9BACI|nr:MULTISPECIES: thioesterase family protein [Bacillus cereus group]ABS22504.1 thioesterase superfamily protein [Bacillus cytotoxicus NVH 391-98]AWC29163.1 acyl-CoA thioesterase [Bacillus cytotoxicus]AWC33149.1 acyl-CoA thioesterase [Bacillus cytotoxicus]AWC37175.1 acyl-CoA thioesterase [Bacillus cytotoxicus]AWC41288.1 acyl-CoA thioesterase [Bacillus cytotoxicus]